MLFVCIHPPSNDGQTSSDLLVLLSCVFSVKGGYMLHWGLNRSRTLWLKVVFPLHSSRVPGSIKISGSASFCVCVGFLGVLQCPPTSQKHTSSEGMCASVCVYGMYWYPIHLGIGSTTTLTRMKLLLVSTCIFSTGFGFLNIVPQDIQISSHTENFQSSDLLHLIQLTALKSYWNVYYLIL